MTPERPLGPLRMTPRPERAWEDYAEAYGMEPLPQPGNVLVFDHLTADREMDSLTRSTTTLPVDLWVQHVYVSRFVLDDEPVFRATVGDLLFMLAEMLRDEGKRYLGEPSVSLALVPQPPERIPDPWWRKPLVWLRLARPRFRDLPPLYALRAEVRAA